MDYFNKNKDKDNDWFFNFGSKYMSKISLFFFIIAGNFLGDTVSCSMRHIFEISRCIFNFLFRRHNERRWRGVFERNIEIPRYSCNVRARL